MASADQCGQVGECGRVAEEAAARLPPLQYTQERSELWLQQSHWQLFESDRAELCG